MSIADLVLSDKYIGVEIADVIETCDAVFLSQVEGVEIYTGDDGWTDVIAGEGSGDPLDILLMEEEE